MNMDESKYSPTREAVFTETMQIGIVVRDLDATLRRYVDDYGIGPWQVHEFDPETAKDMHEYGQPIGRSWRGAVTRFATTRVGRVMWELIEPLDEDSVWARFLAGRAKASTTSPSPRRTSRTRWRSRPSGETTWCSVAPLVASSSPTYPPTVTSG